MGNICIRCHGEGVQYLDNEDCYDRVEQDICYYCSGTGKVDDETYFHDQLYSVCYFLAMNHIHNMIHEMNNDPDGDGFELMAAENMISSREYKRILIDECCAGFADKLYNMPLDDQKLLVAWHNLPEDSSKPLENSEDKLSHNYVKFDHLYDADDDIVF